MGNAENMKKYAHLDQLSTQQLEDILRADSELQDGSDPDMVLYIMEVIENRENGKSLGNKADTERALKEFYELYNTSDGISQSLYPTNADGDENLNRSEILVPHTKKYHFLRRLFISAAAAAIITIFLIPPALGYETFYKMVGTWTDSTFQFVKRDNVTYIDTVWQEDLTACGISVSVLPTKIPEGFTLQKWDLDKQEISGDIEFFAAYTKDDMFFGISVIQYNRVKSSNIEKDSDPVEEYVVDGITYYLFENLEDHIAAWHVDNLECVIYGDLSKDELKMMINSIEGHDSIFPRGGR